MDLIDSDRLCELLLQYELGVAVCTRAVEEVGVDSGLVLEI